MRFDQLKRREFITLLGGAATWPIAARGQRSRLPVIGLINGSSATAYAAYVQAFIRGLAETGHTVGENVAIEYRWAEGHYDRIPDMVDDLVRHRVAVLAPNTPAARAAKRAASNIPIVFFTGDDPVASGLVASLNRPGGNATGVTSLFGELGGKAGRAFARAGARCDVDRFSRQPKQSNHRAECAGRARRRAQ